MTDEDRAEHDQHIRDELYHLGCVQCWNSVKSLLAYQGDRCIILKPVGTHKP